MFCARQSKTSDINNVVLFVTNFHNYVAGSNLFAVNVDSPKRELIWRATLHASAYSNVGGNGITCAVYDSGIVYVGTYRFFGAFDIFTRAVILHQHDSTGTFHEPLIVGNSVIVARGHANIVYAWNKKTGDEVWTFQTGEKNLNPNPCTGEVMSTYFGSCDHMALALCVTRKLVQISNLLLLLTL